jgi:hypothetical protein
MELDENLQRSIWQVGELIAESEHSHSACMSLREFETSKRTLESELFNADDRLLGDEYDEHSIKRLRVAIQEVDKKLANLELDLDVIRLRAREKERDTLLQKN